MSDIYIKIKMICNELDSTLLNKIMKKLITRYYYFMIVMI